MKELEKSQRKLKAQVPGGRNLKDGDSKLALNKLVNSI
jgi:hypothetical protein